MFFFLLIEDQETGEGKALVHPLQISYLESMVQQRLASNETLDFLYSCLHQFCQSLQLEVLQNQTLKLCMQRLGRDVRIEEYKPGRCLTVSYWRELVSLTKFFFVKLQLCFFKIECHLANSKYHSI